MTRPVEKPSAEWVKLLKPKPCDVCGKTLSAGNEVRYFVDGYSYGNEERFTCSGPCTETAKVELALIYAEEVHRFDGNAYLTEDQAKRFMELVADESVLAKEATVLPMAPIRFKKGKLL